LCKSLLSSYLYTNTLTKAFLNWILFDEQFKYVASSSGASQVGADQEFKTVVLNDLAVYKNGYLYVYVSNETPNIDVFFDNLQVTHVRGPILEETHYYPFGLTIIGISTKAMNFGDPENKRKFNKGSELQSKEFSDGSGLEWYATQFRSLDPQLGRWWQIDPKPDYAQSLYSSMNNNPISLNDPLGDTVYSRQKEGDQVILDRTATALKLRKGQANPLKIKEDGEISINKKAYRALNKQQKSILNPLKGMISAKQNFGINVVSKNDVIEPTKPGQGLMSKDGTIDWNVKGLTLGNYYGGGVTKAQGFNKEFGKITTEIFIQSEASDHQVKSAVTGKEINTPNEVIMFHELGHAYYRDVLKAADQYCKALDCENEVRSNMKLEARAYDDLHQYQ
jgi:RHS repeat-associated protein